jgi:hypothetical protein
MSVTGSELLGQSPRTATFGVSSGGSSVFQSLSASTTPTDHATVIARVNGEIVTAVFAGFVSANGCEIVGTLTRAT